MTDKLAIMFTTWSLAYLISHSANESCVQAKILSQIVILALLTQYLLAPKVAEAMRQRAIMLCRAFTTTESQGVKYRVN